MEYVLRKEKLVARVLELDETFFPAWNGKTSIWKVPSEVRKSYLPCSTRERR